MNESEHRDAFESLGAYALGALPDHERAMVAAHIETCPVCAEDARSLERAATHLIDTVPALEPPPELRDRIMAVVRPEAELLRAASSPPEEVRVREPRRYAMGFSLRWAGAMAALALGLVIGAGAFGGFDGSDTRTLSAEVGRGHAWVEVSDGQAELVVDGLPSPGADKVYEMWIQHDDEAPRPASNELDHAVFMVRSGRVDIPAHLEDGDRVMVTAEPDGGSRIPTTTPLVITSRV